MALLEQLTPGSRDPNFLKDSKQHFLQRFWEMYLFVTLQEHGMNPQKGQTMGPDFFLEIEAKRFWVEAIAPDAGDGNDRVPETVLGEFRAVPKREILLRYTNALTAKRDKWVGWLDKGVVDINDGYIVAVNGTGITHIHGAILPFFIEAYLPFGDMTLLINKNSMKTEDQYFQHSDSVQKINEAIVSTALLLDDGYTPISAVLHSMTDCWNRPDALGGDFVVLHNPKATVTLPNSAFSRCLQHHFEGDHLVSLEAAL